MPYARILKENMSLKGIALRCFKLIPYTASVSLKLWGLLLLFNSLAVLMSLSMYQREGYSALIGTAMPLSIICFAVNFILGYSSVKIMQDGVNGLRQDILGAVILTIRKSVTLFASLILLGAVIYFTFLPASYLSGGLKNWYLFVLALVYVFFSPHIVFYPWMIILEDQSVFESFRASYDLAKIRWIKYALLFFLSALIIFFAVAAIIFFIGIISVWFNWEAAWSLWRLNQSLGDAIPLNIKALVLLSQLGSCGIVALFGFLIFLFLSLYIFVFGLNLFVLIVGVSYKTLKDYNLMVRGEAASEKEPPKQDPFEITALFKDVKEITIDTKEEETFDNSAIGHLNRSETLRQFNKEDEDSSLFVKAKYLVHEYPDPEEDEKQ